MKKIIAFLAAAAMLSTLVACGENEDPKGTENTSESAAESSEVETQPDPLAPKTEPEETSNDEEPEENTETETDYESGEKEQSDPLGAGSFALDDAGAVIFEGDYTAESDRTLIAAAQALFESACRIHFMYTVGCPYELDFSTSISNQFGWSFYLITDEHIHSIEDVMADYHKMFSADSDDSEVRSLYIEQDGAVYAMNGSRGSDIYYTGSKITEIQSRSDSEIVFTVENYYDGTDWGDSAYTDTDVFSAVIEDGVLRVGQFTLPY